LINSEWVFVGESDAIGWPGGTNPTNDKKYIKTTPGSYKVV
jgi:hypothetical protein